MRAYGLQITKDLMNKEISIPMLVAQVTRVLIDNPNLRKVTYYADPKYVVSICRRFKFRKRSRSNDFVVKIGQPNFLERKFIAMCKKAKEPFPIKRVQLKEWPKKRKATSKK